MPQIRERMSMNFSTHCISERISKMRKKMLELFRSCVSEKQIATIRRRCMSSSLTVISSIPNNKKNVCALSTFKNVCALHTFKNVRALSARIVAKNQRYTHELSSDSLLGNAKIYSDEKMHVIFADSLSEKVDQTIKRRRM